MNAKTDIEYSNWLNNWCKLHEYKKVDGGVEDGGHFISDEVLFDNFKMEKERNLLTEMHHAVTDVNDNIFEEIWMRVERIAEILIKAGYSEDNIKRFVKEEIYPTYNFIIETT